jgi:hypothetical protein
MEHKMSERAFTAAEIKAAIENYKLQLQSVEKQQEDLEKQRQLLELQQNMLNGAILAFESLFTLPEAPPEPPAEPPNET